MIESKSTDIGTIAINREVIGKYAGAMAVECFGIVGMATISVKDGLVKLLRRDNLTQGIQIDVTADNKLILNFHVIVAYGVNILSVSDNLMDNVKYKVEEFTGLTVEQINIFVEGVRVID
ncbi:MAG: Asp23/Gls24 family envelope stress response protein [Lachnospiraceae bacterium]|nr:Asp23/Gls24 family envelope stress response protein [Lachnospiraceae bacterium]